MVKHLLVPAFQMCDLILFLKIKHPLGWTCSLGKTHLKMMPQALANHDSHFSSF